MNKVLTVGAMVLGALGLAAALVIGGDRMGALHAPAGQGQAQGPARIGLPWDIAVLPAGASRLFGPAGLGLVLSTDPTQASRLTDAQRLWPIESQLAIVAAPGEDGALEVFIDPAQLGFVAGKLVVSTTLSAADIRAMRERATKVEFMESTTRRYTLSAADQASAWQQPITAVTLVPQAQLDVDTIVQRFGPPAQRIRQGEGDQAVEHLLYPDKGLDVAVSAKGKELLQYVPPSQFDRLIKPLQAQARP